MNIFKNITPQKAIIWAIVAIIAVIVINQLLKLPAKFRSAKDEKAQADDLQTSNLSYDLTQYNIYADKLEQIIGPWSTDESAVYAVIKKMKNADDVKQLIKAFGARTFTYLTGKLELPAYMAAGMSETELEAVNQQLKTNNINISL